MLSAVWMHASIKGLQKNSKPNMALNFWNLTTPRFIKKHNINLFAYFAYFDLFPAIQMLQKCQNMDLDYFFE